MAFNRIKKANHSFFNINFNFRKEKFRKLNNFHAKFISRITMLRSIYIIKQNKNASVHGFQYELPHLRRHCSLHLSTLTAAGVNKSNIVLQ